MQATTRFTCAIARTIRSCNRAALAATVLLLAVMPIAGHSAESTATGYFTNPLFMPGGIVMVFVTGGQRSTVPACGAGESGRFAINSTTDTGRAQLAGLLTAFSSKQLVEVHGTGDCRDWGDTESISWFQIRE